MLVAVLAVCSVSRCPPLHTLPIPKSPLPPHNSSLKSRKREITATDRETTPVALPHPPPAAPSQQAFNARPIIPSQYRLNFNIFNASPSLTSFLSFTLPNSSNLPNIHLNSPQSKSLIASVNSPEHAPKSRKVADRYGTVLRGDRLALVSLFGLQHHGSWRSSLVTEATQSLITGNWTHRQI